MATQSPQPLKVLLAIHPKLDALDFIGPLEILSHAYLPAPSGSSQGLKAFECTIAAAQPLTTSTQGVTFSRDVDMAEAHRRLSEFDVMVIPGGGSSGVLETASEPLALIRAYAALPNREDGRLRTLLSVCTGSLFLASQGVLKGLTAVTHPDYIGRLQEICSQQALGVESTKVVDERFVVNRVSKKSLRVITSGGVSCGLDATLWLVENEVGQGAREYVEYNTQYSWRRGTVV